MKLCFQIIAYDTKIRDRNHLIYWKDLEVQTEFGSKLSWNIFSQFDSEGNRTLWLKGDVETISFTKKNGQHLPLQKQSEGNYF